MRTEPPVGRRIAVGLGLLAAVAVVAVMGSLATIPNTDGWYAEVEKVPWDPPNAVFGPVWSVLYLLIAVVGWLIWRAGFRPGWPNAARRPLLAYWVQLVLNALWTPVFFAGFPMIGAAAWWIALAVMLALIVSVVWLMLSAARWSRPAVWLLAPYLLWLLFASTLNIGVIALN